MLAAVWFTKEEAADLLLSSGADVNLYSCSGEPLLVGFFRLPELGGVDQSARLRILKKLLAHGADPRLTDKTGHDAYFYSNGLGELSKVLRR